MQVHGLNSPPLRLPGAMPVWIAEATREQWTAVAQSAQSNKARLVALWGTEEPYLGKAAQQCQALYGVQVVSVQHGFAEAGTYLALARQTQPELVLLGMGMPRQEAIAARLAASGQPCLIVCGGAILDFLGGKVSRAPGWLRRLGCEWLFRLLREPRRLFARYVLGNPLFLLRTLACGRAAAKDG